MSMSSSQAGHLHSPLDRTNLSYVRIERRTHRCACGDLVVAALGLAPLPQRSHALVRKFFRCGCTENHNFEESRVQRSQRVTSTPVTLLLSLWRRATTLYGSAAILGGKPCGLHVPGQVTRSIFTHPNFAFPLPLALPPLRLAARLPDLREHGSCQCSQHSHYGYYQWDPRWHSSHVHILTAAVGRTGVAVQRVACAICKPSADAFQGSNPRPATL